MKKFLLILLAILLLFSTSCFALNLQDSVNTALNNNPDIMASLKKVNAAQGKVMGARGAFFPTVKLNASTGQVYQQPYLLEVEFSGQKLSGLAGYDNTIPMRSIDFTVTQPLFTGGKLLSGASLAHNQYMLAYNDYRKALLDVRYNTTSAYFGVIKAQKTVDLAVQSKTMAEEHLNQVKSMFDLGSVTKADYLRGEVQLANAEVGLTRAKNGLAIAKNSFNNILGLTTEADFDVNQDDLTYKISDLPSYDGLLEIAYKNRPEWQQFELSKDMANDSINLSRADMYPSIALIGTYKSAYSEYPGFFTDQRS